MGLDSHVSDGMSPSVIDLWNNNELRLPVLSDIPRLYHSKGGLLRYIKDITSRMDKQSEKILDLRKKVQRDEQYRLIASLNTKIKKQDDRINRLRLQNILQRKKIRRLSNFVEHEPVSSSIPNSIKEIKDKLCQFSIPVEVCGIYFLINRSNEVVYVGQSINVLGRIPQHIPTKDFYVAYYLPVPKSALNRVEQEWIDKILPIYNTDSRTLRKKKMIEK